MNIGMFLCTYECMFKGMYDHPYVRMYVCMYKTAIVQSMRVREYFEEAGMDISGMKDQELEEASEVFALSDGRYLVVEG